MSRLIFQKLIHIVLVDNKFITSQQFTLSRQRWPTAPWAALGKALPAGWGSDTTLLLVKPHTGCCIQFWLLGARKRWTYWSKTSKGPQRCLRHQSMFYVRWGWENWAWRSEDSGGNLSMSINTWWKGVKQIKPAVPTDSTRDNGHKLIHEILPNINKNFSRESGQILEQVALEDCRDSSLEILKTQLDIILCNLLQPTLLKGWSRSSQEAPSSLCDSVWLGLRGHKFRSQVWEHKLEDNKKYRLLQKNATGIKAWWKGYILCSELFWLLYCLVFYTPLKKLLIKYQRLALPTWNTGIEQGKQNQHSLDRSQYVFYLDYKKECKQKPVSVSAILHWENRKEILDFFSHKSQSQIN